jgi:hypothetical protein
MTKFPRWLSQLRQLAGMLLTLLVDALCYIGLWLCLPPALMEHATRRILHADVTVHPLRRGPFSSYVPRSLPTMPIAFSSMTGIVSSLASLTYMCKFWGCGSSKPRCRVPKPMPYVSDSWARSDVSAWTF